MLHDEIQEDEVEMFCVERQPSSSITTAELSSSFQHDQVEIGAGTMRNCAPRFRCVSGNRPRG